MCVRWCGYCCSHDAHVRPPSAGCMRAKGTAHVSGAYDRAHEQIAHLTAVFVQRIVRTQRPPRTNGLRDLGMAIVWRKKTHRSINLLQSFRLTWPGPRTLPFGYKLSGLNITIDFIKKKNSKCLKCLNFELSHLAVRHDRVQCVYLVWFFLSKYYHALKAY